MTRTLIIMSRAHRDAIYTPRWSLTVEAEADRHARDNQKLISDVRVRLDWDSMIVPDATDGGIASLVDTSSKDRHVLASASAVQARVVVTRNVSDFGVIDLTRAGVSAVHPDLFLAATMTDAMYVDALDAMCAVRSREPNTPAALHAAFGVGHPRLFQRMRHLFPTVGAAPLVEELPAYVFRGEMCLRCGQRLDGGEGEGLCVRCGRSKD